MSNVFRMIRGGAWDDAPQLARVARRFWNAPDRRRSLLGIRLAHDPIHLLTKAASDE